MFFMSATKAKIWVLIILGVFTALIWYAVLTTHRGNLRVSFLNIGQGDAIFIESPTGNQMLIDAGPNAKVLRELGKVMPFYDHSIDIALATHPDKDHIGGFADVLNLYNVNTFLEDGNESETNIDDTMEAIADQKGVRRIIAERGMVIDLGGGAKIFILYPIGNVEGWETNRASIIAKLVYGNTSFMLTGDSPQEIEKYLVGLDGEKLDSDVLKAGHHGSRTSTSVEFVSAVTPTMAIISAGKDNSYGHPHKETIETLQAAHAEILSTAEMGTITLESDGQAIVRK